MSDKLKYRLIAGPEMERAKAVAIEVLELVHKHFPDDAFLAYCSLTLICDSLKKKLGITTEILSDSFPPPN